jgi:SAM-dependent methyltransferase
MRLDEKEAVRKYEVVAGHYHNFRTKLNPDGWVYNEHLEMPATFELLGNLKNKKVLDIGCGAGIYAKEMTKRGAKVKGFDLSPKMLEIAKKENPNLDLKKGSFYKIPFKEKFDIAVAPLVIDYAENWDKVFRQVSKILKNKGYFIFSSGNPVTEVTTKQNKKNPLVREFKGYFDERKISKPWRNILHKKQVKDVLMPIHHKTYETVIKTIVRNGFEIVDYKDCYPLKKSKKLWPKEYEFLTNVPYFCVWKLRKK